MYILREWKSSQSRGRVCPSLLLLVHSWTADSTSNKNTADWILLMMDSNDSSDGLKIRHIALPREPSLSWSSWLDRVAELLGDVSVSASFPIEPFPGWVSCQSCYSLWPYRWFFWMEIEKSATQCTEKKQGELHETELKKSSLSSTLQHV